MLVLDKRPKAEPVYPCHCQALRYLAFSTSCWLCKGIGAVTEWQMREIGERIARGLGRG